MKSKVKQKVLSTLMSDFDDAERNLKEAICSVHVVVSPFFIPFYNRVRQPCSMYSMRLVEVCNFDHQANMMDVKLTVTTDNPHFDNNDVSNTSSVSPCLQKDDETLLLQSFLLQTDQSRREISFRIDEGGSQKSIRPLHYLYPGNYKYYMQYYLSITVPGTNLIWLRIQSSPIQPDGFLVLHS